MSSGIKFKNTELFCAIYGLEPLDTPTKPTNPSKLLCTFCGVEVDQLRATLGIVRQTQTVYVREVVEDTKGSPMTYTERIVTAGKDAVACPEHCLNIGPRFQRCRSCKGRTPDKFFCGTCKGSGEGDMITQGTKFPAFD